MDWFELNSHLRLLRSIYQNNHQNRNHYRNVLSVSSQFVTSGQRFETLKSLRKLLRKFSHRLNESTIISIFNVLKPILNELTTVYFNSCNSFNNNNSNLNKLEKTNERDVSVGHRLIRSNSLASLNALPSNGGTPSSTKKLKKTLSSENVFIFVVRRNEILECIQIIIDLVLMKSDQSGQPLTMIASNKLLNGENHNNSCQRELSSQEDCFGRMFLPDIITLLGHESSDVQRNAIRFLQLYITRTHNLQRMMSNFIENGLQSPIIATQFGALNSLPHLFVRQELRAENLGPVICSLGEMLAQTETQNPHIFYTTYLALERINSLIGSKRFYQYLLSSGESVMTIYETIRKRAASPQVYITNTGFSVNEPTTESKQLLQNNLNNVNNTGFNQQSVGKNKPVQGLNPSSSMGYTNRRINIKNGIGNEETIVEEEMDEILKITKDNESPAKVLDWSEADGEDEYFHGEEEEIDDEMELSRTIDFNMISYDDDQTETMSNDCQRKWIEEKQMEDDKEKNELGNHNGTETNHHYDEQKDYYENHNNHHGEQGKKEDPPPEQNHNSNYREDMDQLDTPRIVTNNQGEETITANRPSVVEPLTTTIFDEGSDVQQSTITTKNNKSWDNNNKSSGKRLDKNNNEQDSANNPNKIEEERYNRSSGAEVKVSSSQPQYSAASSHIDGNYSIMFKSTTTADSAINPNISNNNINSCRYLNPNLATEQAIVNGNVKQRQKQKFHNPNRQVTFANGYRNGGQNISNKKKSLLNPNNESQTSRSLSSDEDDLISRNKNSVANLRPLNTESETEPKNLSKRSQMATVTSASFAPLQSLASLVQLDADTLANLDYIPTIKDYYLPYYHPYYYDPLYHPSVFYQTTANPHLLRFGIFPRVLIYQALSSIADEQFEAVQAIVRIVRDANNEHLMLLLPHMDEFLSVFVAQLLLDGSSNFKVILWTLDIIELLTERFKQKIHSNLSQLVLLLSQRLGDNRIVIRDSVIKVFHQMMSWYCPQEMLDLLFKHVSTKHHQSLAFTSTSKLREEMANRVTAAVATFPRAQLNLAKLCFDVAPFLVDRRALVRLASLECVSSLAQALGPHKLGSLMTAVHSLESSLTAIDFDRLIASIQARLARRSLPRVGPDGNVQYVLRVPTSGESWYYRRIYDADLEWIRIGPTTLPSNLPLLNTPTIVPTLAPTFKPIGDSSENSSSEAQRTNNSTPAKTSQEELLARHQMSMNSADSEDIPPPVKGKVIVTRSLSSPEHDIKKRNRSRSKSRKIDPNSMAQDPPSPMRNFSDRQQQREVEQRFHTLETPNRSKTSQEYRPYGRTKRDQFIERLVRGESVDDSDLADAQIIRRSSTESLEAWRQYFGRFKKQITDISLMGGNRPYGSRPGSSVYYGLSPLPPPPLAGLISPSYYYYYYIANGLSNSYHDLSQLEQKNMMSIMRRSGFLSSDQDQQTQTDQQESDLEPTSKIINDDNKNHSSRKFSQSNGRNIQPEDQIDSATDNNLNKQDSPTQRLEPESIPLERSFSMPSIRTDSSAETERHVSNTNNHSHHQIHQDSQENQISDEVIQELGMWEQVIQEEKNQLPNVDVEEETLTPKKLLLEEDQFAIQDESQQQMESSIKSIPTVSIQPSSPNVTSKTIVDSTLFETVKSELQNQAQTPISGDYNSDMTEEQSDTGSKRKESLKSTSINVDHKSSIGSSEEKNDDSNKNQATNQSNASNSQSKSATLSKTGPPVPSSRRLSRVPQQLYIKTTPAIPMNANIQHILGNVARTEGPFENPYDAVKAALIALRDHAWTTKVEGMLAIVRLATFHPHHLIRDQHQIALALATETRNLRSTVARSAIFTIGELFAKLKSQIEPEMDILTQALLHKVSENSVFIREDIDRALQLMVNSMPQTRAALALITFGSSHRNTHIRRTSSQFLLTLVEKMGPIKCLLGPRDIGEHLLPAAARFIQDHSGHTRYFGRRIFAILMQHPLFDKFLRKHVSPGTYRNICGMLETIKRRGVGDAPPDLYSPIVQPKHSDPRRLVVVEGVAASN